MTDIEGTIDETTELELLTAAPRCRVAITFWRDGESMSVSAEGDDMQEAERTVMEMFHDTMTVWQSQRDATN